MKTSPTAIRTRSVLDEQPLPVGDLIRRVELLMNDERYPPLRDCPVVMDQSAPMIWQRL